MGGLIDAGGLAGHADIARLGPTLTRSRHATDHHGQGDARFQMIAQRVDQNGFEMVGAQPGHAFVAVDPLQRLPVGCHQPET